MPQTSAFKTQPASSPVPARPNILIVDDRRENLIATEKVLRNLDADIFKAGSGNEALSLMLRNRFAVILLDVQMPEMDGFETARLMQEHESMHATPIIFVTAISKEDKYATQAAEIGAVDYIFKPINPEILRSKVKVYLDLYVQREQILDLNAGLKHSNEELEISADKLARDMAQRRQLERQLRQSQKMEAIGNLTGGMAHDFNNLLGVIIGNLDLLGERLQNDVESAKLSQNVLEAAMRGADLTRRLLAFARQQPLQPQRIVINNLVEGITKLLGRTLGENIDVRLDLAKDVWPVVADPAQLEAALANLATNARDAMHHSGRLLIATHNHSLDADYAAQYPEVKPGDYVAIEVSDTGTGIPPEILTRIFEPFFTTKERDKGTGLGLAMVFGFMKQSGGHINVYSEVGRGTTFRLYLPRATGEAQAKNENTPPTPVKGGYETVLAVEDNEAMREVVTRQLKELGYRVVEAENAVAALEKLAKEKVDLLLTDIVMPGSINGLDLARAVMERLPDIKIVLTSGFPDTKLTDNGEALAGLRLLSKPYRKQDLARILREVLEEKSGK